ncbi:MAG: protoporphyrinogen oxidase [Oscillatoria sp. PMC 1068.18]|nr:protoporphyrinogen oxidase [Oscillatoria sp. PMC 1076.18]MEC4989556.1 protoporphyrinogen oxidase [Oscillatoria sp. PMC 1068.18]
MLDTLIIGAGISGLSLAHNLKQNQKQILVTESQGRVGGNIISNQAGEFLWEEGPNSFAPNPALLKLAVDVGLKDELVLADRKLPRYVYWQGKLIPVPMSPPAALTTDLLSTSGKARALFGALGFVPPLVGKTEEETVAEYFCRNLGAEVTNRLVSPFVSGVYAGDVNQLSAQSAFARVVNLSNVGGGLLAGAILSRKKQPKSQAKPDPNLPQTKPGELGSFRKGLQMLPEAIASRLGDAVKLNWKLKELRRTPEQNYLATFDTPEGHQEIATRSIVLTVPAYVAANLLQPLHAKVSDALREIFYPPVACVVLAYPKNALKRPLDGFGNLIPRGEGIRTLGTIWSSTLFPGRTAEGWQILTNFIGGATDLGIGELEEEAIAQAVQKDLSKILVNPEVSPKVLAVHLWKRAIPQYNLGHQQRLATIFAGLEELPGLFLSGNYLDGVSLGDCVRRGRENAIKVEDYLAIN